MKNILQIFKQNPTALLTSVVAILAFTSTVCAEITSPLRFIPEHLDFGMIREDDGKVKKSLLAVNSTSDTTFVISARTSCGCTGVEYDSSLIAPGDTTNITITYDATNRPGKFLKTIKIFTGSERIPNTCKIKGLVIPSKKNLDRTYPEKAEGLRLTTLIVNTGEIRADETRPLFIGIYNDSDSILSLKGESDNDALSINIMPDTIEPNSISTATLKIRARDIREQEFDFKAKIIDAETGKTLATIPIGGTIRCESAIKQ